MSELLHKTNISRRSFIRAAGYGVAAASTISIPAFAASAYLPPSKNDTGEVKNKKAEFPNLKGKGDAPGGETPSPLPESERTGYAIVALGRLSLQEILPAFAQCKRSKIVALVSGTPEKAKLVAEQYGVKPEAIYNYENFDSIKDNKEIDAVYIVLPNSMHREFTERAAKAGKHVLCEKPLATNAKDAKAMVDACSAAGVKLMTAYRCQYEPYNMEVIKRAQNGELGGIRFIEATNTQIEGEPDQWRLKKAMAGGGALPDIGLYCLNAARYVSGEEPSEVFAQIFTPSNDPRFAEVEDRVSFMLRFPSGVIANCATSYDAHNSKDLTVRLENGWLKLEDAFAYKGKNLRMSHRVGDGVSVEQLKITEKNQFAEEIDHFSECVKDNKQPRTPGEEGLQDHIIMEAIYESAATGKPVKINSASAT